MARHWWLAALLPVLVALGGCGGGAPAPAPPGGASPTMQVGPMLIRPASTAGFRAESMATEYGACSFIALSGARIDYLASQALLDRIVFTSDRDGYDDIWVCNLDGSGMTQLTNNTASEGNPQWSPDGTRIVFQREWPGQDVEIITMDADGSNISALTDNTFRDEHPTWSPDGGAIAWHSNSPGNFEIMRMYQDGSEPANLTNQALQDKYPDWSPDPAHPDIAFASARDGNFEIYRMAEDGSTPTRLTDWSSYDTRPAWNHAASAIAWQRTRTSIDVFAMAASGGEQRNFSEQPDYEGAPAWSSDDAWIAYGSTRGASLSIWLQQSAPPLHSFQVTNNAGDEHEPHLGSPTSQIDRVLVGPPGSDWGGHDPIWSNAYAGVVAFADDGYRNFVRIGVRAEDLGGLDIEPMRHTGWLLAALVVRAPEIVNLKEDAGRGLEPVTWQLDAVNAGALVLYFDANSGRLTTVLALRDAVLPTAAGAAPPVIASAVEGDRLVLRGDFVAVFDGRGRDLAPGGAATVALDASGAPVDVY